MHTRSMGPLQHSINWMEAFEWVYDHLYVNKARAKANKDPDIMTYKSRIY